MGIPFNSMPPEFIGKDEVIAYFRERGKGRLTVDAALPSGVNLQGNIFPSIEDPELFWFYPFKKDSVVYHEPVMVSFSMIRKVEMHCGTCGGGGFTGYGTGYDDVCGDCGGGCGLMVPFRSR